jgi:intracellular multiplication protein IcmJ
MHKITLMAKPGAWRLKVTRNSKPTFKEIEQKIFSRDSCTCQFCGFKANEYQDIVNLDNNYRNNSLSNLVTACVFCSQCFFLESVGVGEYGGGTLIYLPEMTQTDLNSLCHVLFCAITNDTGYKATAQSIYRSFKFRSQIVENKFGDGSSNPAVFGQLLIDSGLVDADTLDNLLKDVRLLPSRAKFRQQIEHWASHALDELATEE